MGLVSQPSIRDNALLNGSDDSDDSERGGDEVPENEGLSELSTILRYTHAQCAFVQACHGGTTEKFMTEDELEMVEDGVGQGRLS